VAATCTRSTSFLIDRTFCPISSLICLSIPAARFMPPSESAVATPSTPVEITAPACGAQVCFDPQFAMPTTAQVELAVQHKFTLDAEARSLVAPAEKFVLLTFASATEAKAAANELPELLRRHLQKHSGYSVRTHLMAVARGRRLVKEAADRRRRLGRGTTTTSGGANAPTLANAAPPGQNAANRVSVADPDLAKAAGPRPVPVWQQPPLAAAQMYVPHQMPHAVSPPPMMPHAAIGGAHLAHPQPVSAPPTAPLPSGFLHTMRPAGPAVVAQPAVNAPAAPGAAVGVIEAKQQMTIDVGELGDLAAMLGASGEEGKAPQGSGAAGAPDGAASSMLGLLRQLGSAPTE
jgi:hypothetical protein